MTFHLHIKIVNGNIPFEKIKETNISHYKYHMRSNILSI
jgi:hypothetical protein